MGAPIIFSSTLYKRVCNAFFIRMPLIIILYFASCNNYRHFSSCGYNIWVVKRLLLPLKSVIIIHNAFEIYIICIFLVHKNNVKIRSRNTLFRFFYSNRPNLKLLITGKLLSFFITEFYTQKITLLHLKLSKSKY